jgi:hypothetical protein
VSKDYDILRCHNALPAEAQSASAGEMTAITTEIIIKKEKELKPRPKRYRPAKIKRQENQG